MPKLGQIAVNAMFDVIIILFTTFIKHNLYIIIKLNEKGKTIFQNNRPTTSDIFGQTTLD